MSEPPVKRKRRWILWAGGAAVVFLIAVVLIVPLLIDAESFRPQVERTLSDVTGWDAELGKIELSVLRGALGVRPVTLTAPGDGGSSIEVGRIDVEVGLLALLRKELRVESIRLVQPEILIVRPDAETGWVVPSLAGADRPATDGSPSETPRSGGAKEDPPESSPDGESPPEEQPSDGAKEGFAVVIEEITIRDGSIRFEDRALSPMVSFELSDVTSSFHPADAGITGRLGFSGGGGASWRGQVGRALEVTLDAAPTELLQTFVGPDLVQGGGTLSGELTVGFPLTVHGDLTADGLTLLAGERPFDDASLTFSIEPAGLGWKLETLEFRTGDARLTGSGPLSPDLALALELPQTDLGTAVRASESILPLPIEVVPPGHVAATIRVDQAGDDALTYEAAGSFAAAELRPGEPLPPARDVEASFELDRSGRIDVRLDGGTIAGGPVSGGAAITSIDPVGTLSFHGGLQNAVFGELLGGFVAEARPVLGPTGFDAALGVDLSREALDARSLTGRLDFGASELSMPGWDLDSAVRGELEEKASSGAAGMLKDLLGNKKKTKSELSTGDVAETVERLIDSLEGTLVFDRWPWGLENVKLTVGDVDASGDGWFDPENGAVEFTLTSRLNAAESKKLLAKYDLLKALADGSGRLTLPVSVDGALVSPSIKVELGDALENNLLGDDAKEDDVKNLIRGLLDRKKKKN